MAWNGGASFPASFHNRRSGRDHAFGAHAPFLACVDHRARAWARALVGSVWPELPRDWQLHLLLSESEFDKTIDKCGKDGNETLYGTKIVSGSVQAPWD